MDEIRHLAAISVARACGFGALAVCTLAIALSYEPFLAARSAALLGTLGTAILIYKALRAPHADYRTTEVWIMIDKANRPAEAYAQRLIGGVLHDTYLYFASIVGVITVVLWLVSIALRILF